MGASALFEAFSDLEDRAVHAVLDQFSAGVALLDRELKVQFANAAFRVMASDGPLILRRQSPASFSPPHARKLDRLIHSAFAGASSGTMAIPHPDDGRLVTILVTSVHGSHAFAVCDIAAILFMFDPARPSALPPQWIMDAYGLTMAEAQVALQAATGRSVSKIGIRLNISPNTVKTHLRSIFAKTGVHGQAELVGLIAALGSVRGDCEAYNGRNISLNDEPRHRTPSPL
jgi:DNA-binding CsgD family transcriptional regulator